MSEFTPSRYPIPYYFKETDIDMDAKRCDFCGKLYTSDEIKHDVILRPKFAEKHSNNPTISLVWGMNFRWGCTDGCTYDICPDCQESLSEWISLRGESNG